VLEEMLAKFKENNPTKQLILLFEAGSHFFDLNGPNSDRDYRGLYIDTYQDSFESAKKVYQVDYKTKIGAGKNSSEDIDFTIFSLSSFFKLLKSGDFNMMEILFVPENKILFKTPIYDELVSVRENLLVNDISAFLGFIKKEYKRYGVNIYHYKLQEDFLSFIKQWPPHDRLSDHWQDITNYGNNVEGVRFTEARVSNASLEKMIPSIVIAERLHHNTASIKYVTEAIEVILSRYGHRQKSMAASQVEFKGLFHALRLIYEANDLFDFGKLIFPFSKERYETLKKIKNGEADKEWLFQLIDTEIEKLYQRENKVVSNRKEVEARLDKLEMNLRGRMSLSKAFFDND